MKNILTIWEKGKKFNYMYSVILLTLFST